MTTRRVALISLSAGGAYGLMFTGIYLLTDWPAAWFGVVVGVTIALGLFSGLGFARCGADTRRVARALFVCTAMVIGATGIYGLASPSPYPAPWVDCMSLAIGVFLLLAAATPAVWARRT